MIIKRGIIQSFSAATYTATVLLFEATSHFLPDIPVSNTLDGTSGLASPTPGRIAFVTGFRQVNAAVINSGATSTFTLAGTGGIPTGATGVVFKAFFTSPTVGAFLTIMPHAPSDTNAYVTLGNIQVANAFVNGGGVLQLDGNGQIDMKANTGNCTVTFYTHGYVI